MDIHPSHSTSSGVQMIKIGPKPANEVIAEPITRVLFSLSNGGCLALNDTQWRELEQYVIAQHLI